MRKISLLGIAGVMLLNAISLSACGGNNSSSVVAETEKVEPLDLTGNWVQSGKEGEKDTYQAGFIKDGVIEIYWITDGGNSHSLYWAGSYDAPTDDSKEYRWESQNDRIKTDSALLSSQDDTKTFSYKDGKISYKMSIQGQESTITLVQTETDYSSFSAPGGHSGRAQDGEQIELKDSGYSFYQSGNTVLVYYAAEIYNPNEKYAIEYPSIVVTVKSDDGKILTTDEATFRGIAAQDTVVYGNYLTYEGEPGTQVDISVKNGKDDYMYQEGSDIIRQDQLAITNVSENINSNTRSYTGEITNNSTVDLDFGGVDIIFKKDGKLVGGYTSPVMEIASGQTLPFEVENYSGFSDYDLYEIYGLQ